jgi:hypothetical protein
MDFPGNTSDPEKSRFYLCRVVLFNVLLQRVGIVLRSFQVSAGMRLRKGVFREHDEERAGKVSPGMSKISRIRKEYLQEPVLKALD